MLYVEKNGTLTYYSTSMLIMVFIKDLLVATLSQTASLFAGVFLFGLLINFVSQLIFKSLERAFGRKGVYFVAWLGTPIHELGHALFCVIFMHKIVEIRFFKPGPLTGTLGYVHRRWDHSNAWQMLGNFFIGIGPVILGCGALFLMFYFLIPNSSQVWDSIIVRVKEVESGYSMGSYLIIFRDSSFAMTRLIFTIPNITSWRLWVFFYLSISVASSIRLSPSDVKGALSGLGCVILPFLMINFMGLVSGFGGEKFLPFTASSLGVVYSLFILALIMALLGFILTYLVSALYVKIKYGYLLNPF